MSADRYTCTNNIEHPRRNWKHGQSPRARHLVIFADGTMTLLCGRCAYDTWDPPVVERHGVTMGRRLGAEKP